MASSPPPGPAAAPLPAPPGEGEAPAALEVGPSPEPTPALADAPAFADVIVVKPNDALDVLVARDAALAAEHGEADPGAPLAEPGPKATPAQEWGAAVVLMVIFLVICLAAVTFFRG